MPLAPTYCRCGVKVMRLSDCPCAKRDAAARQARADAKRPSARHRGYDSKWDKARRDFLAANPECAVPLCRERATVVDHIIPHRGNDKLFWDRKNWQGLCTHHHASMKQRQERTAKLTQR